MEHEAKNMKHVILQRSFYRRNTIEVARELLGCFLVRKIGRKVIRARILETEAYAGEDDLASHASKGRTKRTEIMYGEPGRAYVYMIYGMYHCLNIVTERKDFPAAVLIRGVEIAPVPQSRRRDTCLPVGRASYQAGEQVPPLNGPGKLCRFLDIDRSLNDWDVTKGEKLWIERGEKADPKYIRADKRIGIDYAKHSKENLWRFTIKIEE